MGDKVEFTAEEKVILGETPDEPAGAPGSPDKTESTPEPEKEEGGESSALDELLEPEPEKGGEDEEEIPEDGKVPYTRFAKVYGKSKEIERKFDLLRRDPEAYFRLYPDEKPETRSEETKPPASIRADDIEHLKVAGGTFDGMTLAQVRAQDAGAAAQLEAAYMRENLPQIVRSQVEEALRSTQEETKLAQHKEEAAQEIQDFMTSRAEEYFKKPLNQLSQMETKKLEKLVDQCITWGNQTKRGSGKIEDIYYLMTRERQISKAKADGASAVIDSATKGGKVRSIKTGGGESPAGSEFDKLMDLSGDQAAREIENMPDRKFKELMQKGSTELRGKYPGWPWA